MGLAEMVNGTIEQSNSLLTALDWTKRGVVELTKGKMTNKEAFWNEMSKFLLFISYGNGRITEAQADFYNILQRQYTEKSDSMIEELENTAKAITDLDGAKSLIVEGFEKANIVGEQLAFPFDFLGKIMITHDKDPVSEKRYDKYIDELCAACGYSRAKK